MNNLAGFDLVYAVTQKTLNHQLELLWAQGILPQTWRYPLPGGPKSTVSINATLGSAVVNMNVGDASSRKVRVTFPLTGGTISYATVALDESGELVAVSRSAEVAGWKLSFLVNLSLAEIAQQSISESKSIPEEIKAQLTAFTEEMYSIEHLFLNFEDANLIESYQLDAGNNPDMSKPEVIQGLNSVVKSLLDSCRDEDGSPYVLGYSVTDRAPSPATADFNPTGTTYSVYPEPEVVDRSTLNYLSVVGGRTVPGAGYGIFPNNWVTSDKAQGAFVISQELLIKQLLPSLAQVIEAPPSKFAWKGNKLTYEKKPNKEEEKKNGHFETRCEIWSEPNTSQLKAKYRIPYKKSIKDKLGSSLGHVDGYNEWTTTLSFGFDQNNDIKITTSNSDIYTKKHEHPNALGKFENFLADAADEIASATKLTKERANDLVDANWAVNVSVNVVKLTSNLKLRLILPAHGQFFFKDALFSQEGHLLLTTTIKG